MNNDNSQKLESQELESQELESQEVDSQELDIRPGTAIYSSYERYSYKQHYAVAEFIDNSTASYYDKRVFLENFYKTHKKTYTLNIYIVYNNTKDKQSLIIRDNAYGMDSENFKRAITLGIPPKNQNGRNEFGMGLKTAASWFSKKWSVESTQLFSDELYKVTMDIEEFKRTNKETVKIETQKCNKSLHYTQITLRDLNKPFSHARQRIKLVKMLTGMYREDIRQENIKIVFAEQKKDGYYDIEGKKYETLSQVPNLKFEEVEPRIIKPGEIEGITEPLRAIKTIDNKFEFDGKEYKIKGFIGIRKKGNRSAAGFTLLRRGRAIIGGYEDCWRPKDVFGDASSFAYQRIYGELYLDDFPVNQAKDGFSWDNGLEDSFIDFMKKETEKFRNFSNKLRTSDEIDLSDITSKELKKNNDKVEKVLQGMNEEKVSVAEKEQQEETNDIEVKTNGLDNLITFGEGKNQIIIDYQVSKQPNPKEWLSILIVNQEQGIYTVRLNVEHKSLKPFSEGKEFILFMKNFSIGYAVSILKLRKSSVDNRIDPILLNGEINKFLQKIGEEYDGK